jgi:hypothetical protein
MEILPWDEMQAKAVELNGEKVQSSAQLPKLTTTRTSLQ